MSVQRRAEGIVRARKAAAYALVSALGDTPRPFSEASLAAAWLDHVKSSTVVLPYGWYQPPPHGVSVLIGNPPDYRRLAFKSLRDSESWPGTESACTAESILYPYFSTVDRATAMIGDHVGTYYSGSNDSIREWMRCGYRCTRAIAEIATTGMSFSELFVIANDIIKATGAGNGNFNTATGLATDIGHTIPFFSDSSDLLRPIASDHLSESEVVVISKGRYFISSGNHSLIQPPCAFTVEPQLVSSGVPKIGYHMIIIFTDRGKQIVEEYNDLFRFFGMDSWI